MIDPDVPERTGLREGGVYVVQDDGAPGVQRLVAAEGVSVQL